MGAKRLHRLSDVDRDALTASCAQCGPVAIILRKHATSTGGVQARCAVAVAKQRASPNRRRGGPWATMPRPHGLTAQQARDRVRGQQCEICARPAAVNDHDHEAKQLRGVLCHDCNLGLGRFGDDPAILDRAALYLRTYAGHTTAPLLGV